jgi:hypothetical protein
MGNMQSLFQDTSYNGTLTEENKKLHILYVIPNTVKLAISVFLSVTTKLYLVSYVLNALSFPFNSVTVTVLYNICNKYY